MRIPEKFFPQYSLLGYLKRLLRPYRWTLSILLALGLGLGYAYQQAKQREKVDEEWGYIIPGPSQKKTDNVPYLCNYGRVIRDCPRT